MSSFFSSRHTTTNGSPPKDKTPKDAQIQADQAAMEAYLAAKPATKLPAGTADNAVSIFVPVAAMAKAHKARGSAL